MRPTRAANAIVSVALGFLVVASIAVAHSDTSIFRANLLEPNQ